MLTQIAIMAAQHHLFIAGGFAVIDDSDLPRDLPRGTKTLLLLAPLEPGFWPHLTAQPEWDGAPDPMDRWSRRVIGRMACDLRAKALFPFGGPPYHPFYQWALRSGRAWDSPVRLLVHDTMGLFASYRGALALKEAVAMPAPGAKPCEACPDKPCLTACPPRALTGAGYEVPACHQFLNDTAGKECLTQGCGVRRACPVSRIYARMPVQSAYHMGQFHK